ncbi:MAG TPA: ScpA family protein [Acidimicrobiales bacterium]|nr:ScpA family protein [Acidimicrobiales bacterium]
MAYEVHLDVYDGPFELLLHLITAQQVDLYEVRLSDIVDGFLAELRRLENLDLEVATEFLLIAATLVELKCRRLLPGSDDIDLDEELSLFEARDYLLARLLECRTFSEAAKALVRLEQAASESHGRRAGPEEEFAGLEPDLLAGVTADQLGRLMAGLLAPKPRAVVSDAHVHEDEVSVGETLERLVAELPGRGPTPFRALLGPNASKAVFVATFLSLLELYKRELVELEQLEHFGELTVIWRGGAEADDLVDEVHASYDEPRRRAAAATPGEPAPWHTAAVDLDAALDDAAEDEGADDDLPSVVAVESLEA